MRAKKFLSILLALMLVISIIPTSALADEPGEDTTPETVEVSPTEPGEETTEPTEPEEPGEEPTEPEDEPAALADGTITSADELTAAVSAGGDAQLSGDLEAAFPNTVTKDFTLDLGGNTLTLSNTGSITVSGGAKLVFKNGTIIAENYTDATTGIFGITTNSSIELDGVTFTTTGAALFPRGAAACVKVVNSTVTGIAYAVATNAATADNYDVQIILQDSTFNGWSPILLNVPGTLEMTGCTVNGEMHGVIVRGGTAVIKGCTITQKYTDDDAATMANYFNTQNWGSGNMVNLGALVVGNKGGSYQYPSDVTLIDTAVSTAGDNAALFPALFVTANQTDGNGVTLVYDDDCSFDNGTGNAIQIANDNENAVVGTPVAEVGGTPYVTLQAAIDDAKAGDTVKLLKDTATSERNGISIDKNLTIDLNDCAVSGTGNKVFSIGAGKVEIKDGKIVGETKGILCDGGEILLTNVTITAGEHTIHMRDNAVVTVDKDSTVTSTGDVGIYLDGTDNGTPALHVYGTVVGGSYTYDDGETEVYPAIGGTEYVDDPDDPYEEGDIDPADVYIYSGAVIQSGAENPSEGDAIYYAAPGKLVITGGDISGNLNVDESAKEAEISVSGGDFTGDITAPEGITGFISAGSFSSKVEQKYCAKGFVPTEADADGKYTVTPDATKNAATVTKDGVTTVYETLTEAISAAGEGDTITLLQDVETDSKITNLPEGVTLDGQNHKLTLTENVISKSGGVFDINKNNVTIKDLTIEAGTNAKYGVQFYGDITGKLDNVTINGGTFAAVNVNGANVTINGSTLNPAESAYTNIDYSMGTNVTTVPQVKITGTITYDEEKPLVHADQDAMKGVINKTSDGDLTPKDKSDALTKIAENVNVEGQKMVLTEDGKVVSTANYNPSTLTTNISSFVVGEAKEFTFTTTANDDRGIMVIGTSNFDKPEAISKLEYYEVNDGKWYELTGDFGPSTGFPMSDAASTFRVTFKTAGEYTFTASMKKAGSEEVLCSTSVTFTVSEKSAPVTPSTPTGGSHHSSSSSVTTYPVTVDNAKHGTVTASAKNASRGTTVTITVKADDGYELDGLTVTDKDGKTVKVTEGKNGKFTFTMPASKVTIEAGFAKSEETPDQRFTDVPEGYWAEDEINWAAENGYMNGNTATTFNPEGSVTRQQLWMILARLSGYQPADFAEAKAWAVDNGISDGSNPENAVTRQQLVTILYRYAVRMGYKTTGTADLTAFPDHASVAAYATDAMSWSVANGIVGGTSAGTLNPTGTATRAQFAVILYRFCEKVVG